MPKGTISTGSGKRPSIGTHFDSSAITIMLAEAEATIFSRNSAPPPPLIRLKSGPISSAPSMVRSSSGVSSRVDSVMPQLLGLIAGRLRGRHPDHIEAVPDLFAQKVHEMPGRRAGPEAEPHAGPHPFERAGGSLPFESFKIHAG